LDNPFVEEGEACTFVVIRAFVCSNVTLHPVMGTT